MATNIADKSNKADATKDDPLLSLTSGLKFVNYEYSVEKVKTSHFVFSSDVEDFKLGSLSDFGLEVVRNYLHIGIVSEVCEKPYKQYEVLLVHWPPNIPRSSYEDKNRALLVDVKKVRTIIFAVPDSRLRKYAQSHNKIRLDDVVASTAILTEADDWRLMESKVMTSFFNIVDRAYSHVSEGRESWKNYSTDKLDTQWKQMIFLCCFNYDVGYYAKEMSTRNWSRICRKMIADEKYTAANNLLDSEVPRGGIYDLLVLSSRYPALLRDMIKFLKEVNAEKPCLLPLDLLEKLKCTIASILFVTKKFACELCGFVAQWKCDLVVHMRTHTGEKPYKCHLCDYSATQSGALNSHISAHTGEELFQCDFCGKSFIAKASLKYHLASKHHAKGNFNYRCYSCKAQYDSVALLSLHVVIHGNEKKFQCSICLRRFITTTDLEKYTQNHGKEKPFDCHICGKKFLLKCVLKMHYRVHSEKTFMCGFCGKAFHQKQEKVLHELTIHNVFITRSDVIEIDLKKLSKAI